MSIGLALSVLVFVVGLFMYFKASNPKWVETGRIMFAVGLFVSLLKLGGGILVNLFKQ